MTGLRLFSEFLHTGLPSDAAFALDGIEPIKVVYGEQWHSSLHSPGSPITHTTRIDATQEAYYRDVVIPTMPARVERVVLDVENYRWHDADKDTREFGQAQLLKILEIWQYELPHAKIGFYAIGPSRDYWNAIGTPERRALWRAQNNLAQVIFDAQDELWPSVYPFYLDQVGNELYIEQNLVEAQRVARGKPVYAFTRPYGHESGTFPGAVIQHEYQRRVMDNCKNFGADGIVFWGGWQQPWSDMRIIYPVIQRFARDWMK